MTTRMMGALTSQQLQEQLPRLSASHSPEQRRDEGERKALRDDKSEGVLLYGQTVGLRSKPNLVTVWHFPIGVSC